ncbi:DUF222 domain-containing protein, partial [Nocardioides caeni]|uniref:DUF222 domain-containing protein n=1 Tax=Nocardioides caeni TaxID=574700 RepID=UPI0013053DC8
GIDDLPDHLHHRLGPDLSKEAEKTLVGYATRHRPSELRTLARRILDVVAPEIAQAEDAKRLEAEERRAREKASLRFRRNGDGTTRINGLVPDVIAGRLQTYLAAYTSPRHNTGQQEGQVGGEAGGEADRIPMHRKRAHALAALLEHLDPDHLPEHGGLATTVI